MNFAREEENVVTTQQSSTLGGESSNAVDGSFNSNPRLVRWCPKIVPVKDKAEYLSSPPKKQTGRFEQKAIE